MKNLQEKLANVQVAKLEERKEFTFYCTPKPCNPPQGGSVPPNGGGTPPNNPGNGGGSGWGGN